MTVHPGHKEIEQDNVNWPGSQNTECRGSIRDRNDVKVVLEHEPERLADSRIVVDGEDNRRCGRIETHRPR
jgi:hypothetical protein